MIDQCRRCHSGPTDAGDFYVLSKDGERSRHFRLCPKCAADHVLRLNSRGDVQVESRRPSAYSTSRPLHANLQFAFRVSSDHDSRRVFACRDEGAA